MTKLTDRILKVLTDFFKPVISGWNKLDEPDRYIILTGMGLCVFCLAVIKFNLFAEHLEIAIGILLGTLFGSVIYFNRVLSSLKHTR